MVFSFFKKSTEKMVAKPAAVPRPKEASTAKPLPASGAAKPNIAGNPPVPKAFATAESQDVDSSIDFSDFVFSESSPDFQIEAERDPVDAEAEEAAVLFANGQDEAVRSVLENAVRIHQFGPGERLWLMLFDLYHLLGKKAAFEALEVEFVRSFEKSPPAWRGSSLAQPKVKEATAGSLLFRGDLTGDNVAAFESIQQALDGNPKLKLDLSKVTCLDAGGCGYLLNVLQDAKKVKRQIELIGRDSLVALMEAGVKTGHPENQECWLLLLELLQLQGLHDAFEETAINYAITFEVSPPSWEPKRVAAPEPVLAASVSRYKIDADAYALSGDVKAARFADLTPYAEVHDPVLIDCAALQRMDFISAGALLNVLSVVRRTGKQIVFSHPNHLVAELFGVVGLTAVATIVFAKN